MARLEQHSLGTRIRTNDYDYVAERRQVAILVPDQGLARSSTEMCTHKKPKDGCARQALLPYPLDLVTKRDSNVVEEHHWVHRGVRRLPHATMLSWEEKGRTTGSQREHLRCLATGTESDEHTELDDAWIGEGYGKDIAGPKRGSAAKDDRAEDLQGLNSQMPCGRGELGGGHNCAHRGFRVPRVVVNLACAGVVVLDGALRGGCR